jgi:dTDP-4-dehydrorhamnose reductase
MRVLLIGHRGQLGSDLRTSFSTAELILTTQEQLCVRDQTRVHAFIQQCRPDLILNCAAFHRVDECEDRADLAFDVNVFGVRNLALAARDTDAALVHFSTDYVFDGPRPTGYTETQLPSPRCIYGVSKLSGEFMLQSIWPKHFIFRVSGLYGYAGSREKGTNFVETMIGLARQGKPIRVVNDQVLTPTSTQDVARILPRLVDSHCYGLYHLTNTGQCSWYEFAAAIFQFAGLQVNLTAVTSDAYPTKARRPEYSVLDNQHLRSAGYEDLPHWRDALERYIKGREAAGRA